MPLPLWEPPGRPTRQNEETHRGALEEKTFVLLETINTASADLFSFRQIRYQTPRYISLWLKKHELKSSARVMDSLDEFAWVLALSDQVFLP